MIGLELMAVQMHVPGPIMMFVLMQMPSLAIQFASQGAAQDDQEQSNAALGCRGQGLGNTQLPHHHDGAHDEQGQGMSDAPPKTHSTGRAEGGPLSQHGRDGGQMIGVERMAKPQQESDAQQCEGLSVWHEKHGMIERCCDAAEWRQVNTDERMPASAAARVHFQVRIFTQPIDADEAALPQTDPLQSFAFFGAPIPPRAPPGSDRLPHLLRRRTGTKRLAEIRPGGGKSEAKRVLGRQH